MATKGLDIDAWIAKNSAPVEPPNDDEEFLRAGLEAPTAPVPAKEEKPLWDGYKEEKAKLHEAATGGALKAAAYGVARGGTMGLVDRLAGLGAVIGDKLASSVYDIPESKNAYQEGRKEYLDAEKSAQEGHPIASVGGEIIGSVIPTIAAAPISLASKIAPASKLASTGLRMADQAVLGGVSAAGNTASDDISDIARNAAKGAGVAAATEGTVGTLLRSLSRGAPKRKEDAVLRDIVESDAGSATATSKKMAARDIDDIRDVLKNNPDAAEAMKLPAKQASEVVKGKITAAREGQAANYASVDDALGKDQLTVIGLLKKVMELEKELPDKQLTLGKKALKDIRDGLREDFAARWNGDSPWTGQRLPIKTEQLRQWVTSVGDIAERAMGGINLSGTKEVKEKVANLVNGILEERLDKAASKGAQDAVAAIRESDRQTSAWLRIDRMLKDRQYKEELQNIGFSQKLRQGSQGQADAAGAALAMSGNIPAAIGVVGQSRLRGAMAKGVRAINDDVLAPIAQAAQRGAAWAQVSQMAMESGLPQGVARAVFARSIKQPYSVDQTREPK